MRWNAIERYRGPLEDSLIDDLVEWSIWHYPIIRQYVIRYHNTYFHLTSLRSGQSVLEAISNVCTFCYVLKL